MTVIADGRHEEFPTIFDGCDSLGFSDDALAAVRRIGAYDRVRDIARHIAIETSGDPADADDSANALFALVMIEWREADEVTRAAFVDLFGTQLGDMGLRVTLATEAQE